MPWRMVPPRAFWPRPRVLPVPVPVVPPPLPMYPPPPAVIARRRWRRAVRRWW
ncbi:MAG TPA: hypothetical protein VHD90_11645 [Phototrophicaceae bacterium]|nr:hypothetical protein [Phototrophicaceae bacterium]